MFTSGVVIFLLDAMAQFAYPAVSGPASEAPTSEAWEEAARITARACALNCRGLSAAARAQASASGRRVAASPHTCSPTSTLASFVFSPVFRTGSTRSSSKSVIVSTGSGSELEIPGISLESSDGGVTPRCFRQGSPLRVFAVIHRRSASFAPMPITRGGLGVGTGSLRVASLWLRPSSIVCLVRVAAPCRSSSRIASATSPSAAVSWEEFVQK